LNQDKASRYHGLRRRADFAGACAAALLLLTLILTNAALAIREVAAMVTSFLPGAGNDIAAAALMALAVVVLMSLVELPIAWYQGFQLEHRYALSTQTAAAWISDHVKGAALGGGLMMLGASIVYAALAWSTRWWWAAAAAVFAIGGVALVRIAPVALLPLFYRFRPLDRPLLVERLLALAARANTKVMGIFEWQLSAHTRKANAALAGLGRTRRILLSDTLLADYSDDEIEVVLAHELAHHVHGDLWRMIALQTLLLVTGFLVAHIALSTLAVPLGLAGMNDPAGLPLLMLVGGAWSLVLMPFANALSRAHERKADRYALETTRHAAAFVSAMRRLAQQNLAEERPSRLVQWLFYSHPPIGERIRAAERHMTTSQESRGSRESRESVDKLPSV
jgi:STE24 endopeptidase